MKVGRGTWLGFKSGRRGVRGGELGSESTTVSGIAGSASFLYTRAHDWRNRHGAAKVASLGAVGVPDPDTDVLPRARQGGVRTLHQDPLKPRSGGRCILRCLRKARRSNRRRSCHRPAHRRCHRPYVGARPWRCFGNRSLPGSLVGLSEEREEARGPQLRGCATTTESDHIPRSTICRPFPTLPASPAFPSETP